MDLSRGLGDVYKRQHNSFAAQPPLIPDPITMAS
jgi:hypothetical protein